MSTGKAAKFTLVRLLSSVFSVNVSLLKKNIVITIRSNGIIIILNVTFKSL